MKIEILLTVIFISSAFLSACQPVAGGDMSAKVTPRTFLFDTTGTSCTTQYTTATRNDLSSLYMDSIFVTLTNPVPGAAGTAGTIFIAYIDVTLSSSNIANGQQTYHVIGDELRYSWLGAPAGTLDQAIIYPGETHTNVCGIKLGGIAVLDKTQYTIGSGRVYIYGTTVDANNNTVPITDLAYFDWTYNGNPK